MARGATEAGSINCASVLAAVDPHQRRSLSARPSRSCLHARAAASAMEHDECKPRSSATLPHSSASSTSTFSCSLQTPVWVSDRAAMQLITELTHDKKLLETGLTRKGRSICQRQPLTEKTVLQHTAMWQSNPAAMSQVDLQLLRRCRLKLATGMLDRIG